VVRASRIFPDGTADAEPLVLGELHAETAVLPGTAPSACSVTYDGSRFVVVWASDGTEYAVTVAHDGTRGPTAVVVPASSAPFAHAPVVASSGSGKVLLGYDRFDAAPSALTSRVKLRVLADGPSAIGSECSGDADCASSFCVDGLCCNERCSDPGSSCARAENGMADGVCTPTNGDTPDAGSAADAGTSPVRSCSEPDACPPSFRCDPVKLVCIPPALPPSAGRDSAGCGCRASSDERTPNSTLGLVAVLLVSAFRRKARGGASRPVARRSA